MRTELFAHFCLTWRDVGCRDGTWLMLGRNVCLFGEELCETSQHDDANLQ